jgi:hypothetical protein
MMSQPASVEAESADGLSILFETMVENSEALEKEQITFQGKAGDSVSLGSGLPEITDLIISLGSAGAFTALAAVFRTYFGRRPKGIIRLSVKTKQKTVEFTAENSDSDQVARSLKGLLS